MPVNVAVIPVAGFGTRLLPLTKSVAKELLPLGGKPVLQHVVEEMQDAGLQQIVMITSELKKGIETHFESNPELVQRLRNEQKPDLADRLEFVRENTSIDYLIQHEQKGLGHAVLCARDRVGNQPFLVALGDAMIGLNQHASLCKRMIRIFDQHNADAVIAFQQVADSKVGRYGIASLQPGYNEGDELFVLNDLIEKPTLAEAPSTFAIAARYICKPVVFEYLQDTAPGVGGEIQLTDAIRTLLKNGGKVLGVPLREKEKRYDVGSFDSYYQAFLETALADPQYGPALKQKMQEILQSDGSS